MNKGITLLVLVAVLGAMGLVLYSHSGSPKEPEALDAAADLPPQALPPVLGGTASPLQNLQGESQGLRPIEPPIGGARSELSPPEGAPVPVTLGPDGRPARPAAVPESAPSPPPQEKTPPAPPASADKQSPPRPDKLPDKPQDKPRDKAQSQPDKRPPPAEEKSPSAAPGLEPWTVPPPGGAAATAPLTVPPQAQADAAPPTARAGTQLPASPPPVLAEQRLATDPIRPVELPAHAAHSLTGISLTPSGQGLRLRIEADSAFVCKTFILTGPDRLVVDLPGAWKGMKAPQVPQNALVKHARLGQQPGGPRLVLDLSGPLKQHRTERSGAVVDVLLNQ
ncbi:AMIN domain-containing protein [Desulfovibrio sp. OttesenSCG-928-G11]|nr:AMIN domain-containing protein [Desulfovibrio sp. OttesenSCG-928-G11]